jgi:hypothetical protein
VCQVKKVVVQRGLHHQLSNIVQSGGPTKVEQVEPG